MFKDEFNLLRGFTLALTEEQAPLTTVRSLEDRTAFVCDECKRIKGVWTALLFSRAKDYMIRRYIWFQQQSLKELADQAFLFIQQHESLISTSAGQSLALVKLLLEQLLELNDFLVQYFLSYFNQNSKILNVSTPSARESMGRQAQHLSALLQNVGLDNQLKTCIRNYLAPILKMNAGSIITHRSYEYLVQFAESVGVIIASEEEQELTERVSEALFYLNFNHPGFLQWWQDRIRQTFNSQKSPEERLAHLMERLIFTQTAPVRLTVSYEPDIPPISLLVEKWLLKEINKESEVNTIAFVKDSKMSLTLSVAHLGLLIRLLYDEGLFGGKNASQVLRFFSRYFTSKRQDHISPDSLRKSFYTDDKFTASVVKEILMKMLDKLNRSFFP